VPPVVDQVNALEHAAPDQPDDAHWLPSQPLTVEMLRRLLESTQYTSWAFTERAKDSGLLPSMGTIGDAYDNAVIESFWARMQTELLDRRRWTTRIELANAIFEYLEIFHNRQRRHSALGWPTPVEFEKLHATDVA
jgi:putative transposase